MDMITEEDLKAVEPEVIKDTPKKITEVTQEEFSDLIVKMENPVDFQKDLAVKIKLILDDRMRVDQEEKGFISEGTRKWISDYNNVLNNLHKNIHGDKSVNMHIQVGHAAIASKIRKFSKKNG